jgi:hypothetical protein
MRALKIGALILAAGPWALTVLGTLLAGFLLTSNAPAGASAWWKFRLASPYYICVPVLLAAGIGAVLLARRGRVAIGAASLVGSLVAAAIAFQLAVWFVVPDFKISVGLEKPPQPAAPRDR